MKSITIRCLSEAVAPLTHMSRSEGNESLIAIEPIATTEGVKWVPYLSGNALRHRLVREPGARYLVEQLGLKGQLTLQQLNFLFHGGNLTEGGGKENTARIAEMYRLFPLLRLLGGCLPDQVLTGSLHVWRGTLICRENASSLQKLLPDGWMQNEDGARLRHAQDYLSGYQYTRSDAQKTHPTLVSANAAEPVASNLMIFSGQAVMRGTTFLHGFVVLHPSPLELGALLHAIVLWSSHGTIGGQAARGHGKIACRFLDDGLDYGEYIAEYVNHVEQLRDECRQWLMDVFAPKAPRTKKAAA